MKFLNLLPCKRAKINKIVNKNKYLDFEGREGATASETCQRQAVLASTSSLAVA